MNRDALLVRAETLASLARLATEPAARAINAARAEFAAWHAARAGR